jgi:hypothetical protein
VFERLLDLSVVQVTLADLKVAMVAGLKLDGLSKLTLRLFVEVKPEVERSRHGMSFRFARIGLDNLLSRPPSSWDITQTKEESGQVSLCWQIVRIDSQLLITDLDSALRLPLPFSFHSSTSQEQEK